MAKVKIEQKAKTYFKKQPLAKEVFASSDDFLFALKQDALAHAKTLDKKEVKTFKNEKIKQVDDSEDEDADGETGDAE